MLGSENDHEPSNAGICRLTGALALLFLIPTVLSGVVAVPLVDDDVANTLREISNNSTGHRASLVLDWVSYIAMIGLAGSLYVLFQSRQKALALLGTLFLVSASSVLIVHDMINMALTSVAKLSVTAGAEEAVALQAIGASMITTAKWGVSTGFTCFAVGTLLYSALMVISGALPRALGWLGIVASVLTMGTWLPRIDDGLDPFAMALFVPMILWLLGIGFWLLLRGTNDAAAGGSSTRI
jgi:hypothetical protein